jgi:hypothetical protein
LILKQLNGPPIRSGRDKSLLCGRGSNAGTGHKYIIVGALVGIHQHRPADLNRKTAQFQAMSHRAASATAENGTAQNRRFYVFFR